MFSGPFFIRPGEEPPRSAESVVNEYKNSCDRCCAYPAQPNEGVLGRLTPLRRLVVLAEHRPDGRTVQEAAYVTFQSALVD